MHVCACVRSTLSARKSILKADFFHLVRLSASVVVKACCHGDKQFKNPLLTDGPPAGDRGESGEMKLVQGERNQESACRVSDDVTKGSTRAGSTPTNGF